MPGLLPASLKISRLKTAFRSPRAAAAVCSRCSALGRAKAKKAAARTRIATTTKPMVRINGCPLSIALVQLQAEYHHCDEVASEKCLSAATFVRRQVADQNLHQGRG